MSDEPSLEQTRVVTVFLRNDAAVLLLLRSDAVGSYAGRWGAVAGHVEPDATAVGDWDTDSTARDEITPDADDAALEEIREETGIDPETQVRLVRRGDPFEVDDTDRGTRWLVHPYLFDAETSVVETDDETSEYEWVAPTEILRRETVPGLWTSYDRVRPTVESVAADRDHGSDYMSVRALEVLRDEAALAVEGGKGWSVLTAVARDLVDARPSMSVVATRVDRAMTEAGDGATPAALEVAAAEGIEAAITAGTEAAAITAERLPDRVATLSWSGTVGDALERADPAHVLVAESRPGREGIEMAERIADSTNASVTLTSDAAFAERLVADSIDALVVGADSVRPDGTVVNKVGTRGAAIVAAAEGIDCYAVTASDKIARSRATGDETASVDQVDREERDPAELYDGDAPLDVANPTFDATPVDRFDAVLTERGALDEAAIREGADEHRALAAWRT